MEAPLIIAHRTCPQDAPENSLEGLAKATALGAGAVEIDLRMSLDQRPYLMHDWTMRRTAGFPLPIELTPSSIVRRQRLANGEPVPTLAAALDALQPGLLLAVEVKTPWAVLPLIDAVLRRRLEQRVLIWSFSALAVRYAARRAPAVETAYLHNATSVTGKRAFLAKAKRLGAKAVSAAWQAIDDEFVAAAHALGLRVYSWHAAADLTPEKLGAGLDGLITDFPRQARAAYAAAGAS